MSNQLLNKKSLGRGLSSLLPENPVEEKRDGFQFLNVNKIHPNPYQPRQHIPLPSLLELSESIKEKGVITPLTVVRSKENDDEYILVAGERRLQAAKLAGFDEVPVVVKEFFSNQEMAEVAIIENVHRKDLNPIEEGYAFSRLFNEFKVSLDEIAQKISKTKVYVENKIRLIRLPQLIQNAIAIGDITENHGRILFGLNNEQAMIATLKIIIRNGLNTKKTEELVRQIKSESDGELKGVRSSPTIEWEQKFDYIKTDLNSRLGFDVRLKRNKKNGGALLIEFNNDDELVSLYRKIAGEK